MRLWTVGAKVNDVDEEVRFLTAIGATPILPDDRVHLEGRTYRIPLIRWGSIRVHLAEEMVYEQALSGPSLPAGLCHLVFEVDNFDEVRTKALAAGAHEITPPSRVEAGFGTRDVAFFRSPGGILFEIIRILEDRVGER